MLADKLDLALKEWSVVQRSLLDQHQMILVRKGGISEDTGDFDLRSRQFLLLPTLIHESARKGDLQPCFQQWLDEELRHPPVPGTVTIECACEVADVIRVDDRNKLVRLAAQHIWSRQFIDGRYEWEPYKPVSVILLRAYRLAHPVTIPNSRAYGGCRSWVSLEEPISTSGAIPAIVSEQSFTRRVFLTSELLKASD